MTSELINCLSPQNINEEADYGDECCCPYKFISLLPSYAQEFSMPRLLPRTFMSKQTLVLDLDETLVHCSLIPICHADFNFTIVHNSKIYTVFARKRPFLDFFMETVSREFEIIIFTASHKVYADKLLDFLDPERKYIQYRLFREACLGIGGNFIKDLNVLNRDLSQTLIVDNSPQAYGYNIDNGVPIESWFDDESDTELLKLIGFLRRIKAVPDVRTLIRDHFQTYKLIENAAYIENPDFL